MDIEATIILHKGLVALLVRLDPVAYVLPQLLMV